MKTKTTELLNTSFPSIYNENNPQIANNVKHVRFFPLNELAATEEILREDITQLSQHLVALEERQTSMAYYPLGAKAGNLEIDEIMALSASMMLKDDETRL